MRLNQTSFIEFDHAFLMNNPEKLDELVRLDRSIWERDPNFREYRICPNHNKYFGWEQVEVEGITHCPFCGKPLELAWEPEQMKKSMLGHTKTSHFFGVLAINGSSKIIGFAWGIPISFEKISTKWGKDVCAKLKEINAENSFVIYFASLAVAIDYRGKGIGGKLLKMVGSWYSERFPRYLGLLRTHEEAKDAVRLYQKVGYKVLCDDTEHGDGRILMYIPRMDLQQFACQVAKTLDKI